MKMFRIFGKKSGSGKWIAAELTESGENDCNPGRGWYRLYPFAAEAPIEEAALRAVCCKDEPLAMVQIDLGRYRDGGIEEAALGHVREILEFFRQEKKELLLRFLYDREGRGMEREPSGIQTIQLHMRQLGPILRDYHQTIFVLQGLFVGSWGEMHGSKFLTRDHLRNLYQTLREATGGSCRIAVRRPQYLRMLCEDEDACQRQDIALYNDGMLASESDFGTYGTKQRTDAAWEEAFCRADEFAFQDRICRTVPNGGEVVNENPRNDLERAIADLRQMHVTYLHSRYDLAVLEKWKNSVCLQPGVFQGKSGYDYIGAHLGYRFAIRSAVLDAKKKPPTLDISVENTGFANVYDGMRVWVLLRAQGKTVKKIPIPADTRAWNSGETSLLSAEIGEITEAEVEVWLQIEREKDGAAIRLANRGAGDALFLGRLLHGKRP